MTKSNKTEMISIRLEKKDYDYLLKKAKCKINIANYVRTMIQRERGERFNEKSKPSTDSLDSR